MRRLSLPTGVLLIFAVLAGAAKAQTPAGAALSPTETMLHLSATGSVQAPPDELVAELLAQVTSPSAVNAQRRVNEVIAAGMKAARSVAGVEVRAVGYSVSPNDDRRATWTAQQTLELRGSERPALLDLVGTLQGLGLAAVSLDWQLSPALRRKAHDDATTAALQELQARAASAAVALGLHVGFVSDVRLDEPDLVPHGPFPAMALPARTMAAPPPQATAVLEQVTAQVVADVVLHP